MHSNKLMQALISAAVTFIFCETASASLVVSWDLGDFDQDGLISSVTADGVNGSFGSFGETGCSNAPNGSDCIPIWLNTGSINRSVFTAGFTDPVSGQPLEPFIPSNIAADISNSVLNFSALDIGFQSLNNTTLTTVSGTGVLPPVSVEKLIRLGAGQYGVVVTFTNSLFTCTTSLESGQGVCTLGSTDFDWRLEGVMTTVPLPTAAWLFCSGLLGLIAIARCNKDIQAIFAESKLGWGRF